VAQRAEPKTQPRSLPLNEAQRQLWTLAQLSEAGSLAYHVPIVLKLTGQLDMDALTQSIQYLVDRHEALRTTFPTGDEQIIWGSN